MKTLAERIAHLSPQQRALLELKQKQLKAQQPSRPSIPRKTGAGPWPASVDQAALWFLHQVNPESTAYSIASGSRLLGPVDPDLMTRALNQVVARHEILRTTFQAIDGQPYQIVASSLALEVEVTAVDHLPREQREAAAGEEVSRQATVPFDLAKGPLLRLSLIRIDTEDHVILAILHHGLTDWWSFQLFFSELFTYYGALLEGKAANLPPMPIQFTDYAVWRNQWLQSEAFRKELAYWLKKLEGAPTLLEIPGDRPRPPVPSYRGAREFFTVPAKIIEGIRAMNRKVNTTTLMTTLAATFAFVSRYTGARDVLIGTSVTNREPAETHRLIGYLLNILVLRGDLTGDPSFARFMEAVRKTVLEAFDNNELPFRILVEELNPERDLSRMPVYQIEFIYVTTSGPSVTEMPALAVEKLPFKVVDFHIDRKTSAIDLQISFLEMEEGMEIWIEYLTDLFDAETVRRMGQLLLALFESMLDHPHQPISEVPWLPDAERERLLVTWNQTGAEFSTGLAHHLFEAQVSRDATRVAVEHGSTMLTYTQVNEHANRLAGVLRARGVTPETRVGICLERTQWLPIAVLAAFKAGAAYVPLDPSHPRERLNYIASDAGLRCVLIEDSTREYWQNFGFELVPIRQDRASASAWAREHAPESAAYVIYTSGSTGQPKGVVVSHRSLVNFLTHLAVNTGIEAEDRLLAVTTLSFDISLTELLLPLTRGAAVVVASRETANDGNLLGQALQERNVSVFQATPATYRLLLAAGWEGKSELRCFCGGEALPPDLVAAMLPKCGRLWNLYGPTEATVWCTSHRVRSERDIHIGRPIANTRLYILDPYLRPVPAGVAGELCIGGLGLARGYHNRPALTAERFVPDALSGESDARLYRSGDLTRFGQDGHIQFLGRLDFQVKIRGFRIELGEIETVLAGHPEVSEAVAVSRQQAGDTRLVAYFTLNGEASAEELRQFLQTRLPGYMIPAHFVTLEEIPRNTSGKVDRRALPAPEIFDEQQPHTPPRNALERDLAEIWRGVLGAGRLGIHDSFFALGGHSLLATQVVSRVRQRFNVEVPLKDFFARPTVAGLASWIEAPRAQSVVPPMAAVPRDRPLPLSFAQERMWFLDRLQPGGAVYNMPIPVRLEGRLDRDCLERALQAVIDRHESLRTHFTLVEDMPVQVIDEAVPLNLEVVSLENEPGDREAAGVLRVTEDALQSFDLETCPLFRITLYRIHDSLHFLLANMHHIVSDGWSLTIFFRELATLYRAFVAGKPSPLPPLSYQYVDYAAWQRDWLRDEVLARELSYWRESLQGAPAHLDLPTDRPRPANQTFNGAMLDFWLSDATGTGLEELCAREGATLFMALVSAYGVLLGRYARTGELCIGTPIANRNRASTEDIFGLFVNTLVLRLRLVGKASFSHLLREVRRTALEAYSHQDIPFEQVVDALQPERDMSRSPIFQTLFSYENIGINAEMEIALPEFTIKPLAYDFLVAKFDLSLHMAKQDRLYGVWEYNTDLFERETVERLSGHFQNLVAELVERPRASLAGVNMLAAEERHRLLWDWNRTARDYPRTALVHELFERVAQQNPRQTALVFEERSLTYGDLEARSNRLAHWLAARGVGCETKVGVCMEPSLNTVTALIAILKAGGVYVPLDREYPAGRIRHMVVDADVSLVLLGPGSALPVTGSAEQHQLTEDDFTRGPESCPHREGYPHQAAYVMFTSGSTGQPKGVVVTHRNIVRLVMNTNYVRLNAGDVILLASTISFDASTFEIWASLLHGAKLVIAPFTETDRLPGIIAANGISTLWLTAQLFNYVVDEHLEKLAGVRQLLAGGEALSPQHVRKFMDRFPQTRLINGYGPTESTTFACCCDLRERGLTPFSAPIGKPIANTTAYVLDGHLQSVPVGVAGELLIGGDGLARCYSGRPDLTASRFFPHPFPPEGSEGERLYRSGDLVRFLPDGHIEFLGRVDRQVKIRGFRIELGEIEHHLHAYPGVRDALAHVRVLDSGDMQLVGYWVGEAGIEARALQDHLAGKLPAYMIPAALLPLEAIPLTANRKIDYRALPAPDGATDRKTVFVAPRTETERVVVAIWQELLPVEEVSVTGNFFEMGGHSLLATRAVTRLRKKIDMEVPLQVIFNYPVAENLARYLDVAKMSLAAAMAANEVVSDDEEEGVI